MTRPQLLSASVTACLLMSALPGRADLAGPLDFETAGQLGANFRATLNGPNAAEFTDSGGYVGVNGPQTAWIGIFDTTPGNSADAAQTFAGPIQIHLDISASFANASFGIFLFDGSNPNGNNLLALLNVNSAIGGTNTEQIRFWRDVALNGSGVANPFNTSAITGTNGFADIGSNSWISSDSSGLVIDTSAPFTFSALDFLYDPTARTLGVSAGNFSATLTIPVGEVITNPGIALRINDPGTAGDAGTQKFDNFTVTAVPEPTTAALLLFGLTALARRRRTAYPMDS